MSVALRLQQALGYQFSEPELLSLALTHCSVGRSNNERLEFLGDSILNYIIAQTVYERFPTAQEGELSRMRATLVKGTTLADIGRELDLGDYVRLGLGERKSGGHRRASILADAVEAILGAILLDGGIEQCSECVLRLFETRLQKIVVGKVSKDAKTQLQEFLQSRGNPLPEYALLDVSGDDHSRQFRVACRIKKPALAAEGEGSSRRKAEQSAAVLALKKLSQHGT